MSNRAGLVNFSVLWMGRVAAGIELRARSGVGDLRSMVLRRTDLLSPAASFEQLINEAIRRGIDVINLLSKALDLNPGRRAVVHLELAEKFLNEGVGLVDKDPAQASEKLYKAAEEAVKALAITLGLNEARTALEQDGRQHCYSMPLTQ